MKVYRQLHVPLSFVIPSLSLRVISDLGLRPPVGSILQFAPANSGLKVVVFEEPLLCTAMIPDSLDNLSISIVGSLAP